MCQKWTYFLSTVRISAVICIVVIQSHASVTFLPQNCIKCLFVNITMSLGRNKMHSLLTDVPAMQYISYVSCSRANAFSQLHMACHQVQYEYNYYELISKIIQLRAILSLLILRLLHALTQLPNCFLWLRILNLLHWVYSERRYYSTQSTEASIYSLIYVSC